MPARRMGNISIPRLLGANLYNRKFAFGRDYYCAKMPFGANLYINDREDYVGTIWDDTDIVHKRAALALVES